VGARADARRRWAAGVLLDDPETVAESRSWSDRLTMSGPSD
jgi:hypothetical protein